MIPGMYGGMQGMGGRMDMGMGGGLMPGMMPGMGGGMMPGMGVGMMDMNQGMNIGGNQNWMQGYNTSNNTDNTGPSTKKISFMFKSTQGQKPIMVLMDYGKTVNDLVKIYFARVGQPDLINNKEGICLLYNATKIPFDSTQKIEEFFKGNSNPQILVNDVNNLIGA